MNQIICLPKRRCRIFDEVGLKNSRQKYFEFLQNCFCECIVLLLKRTMTQICCSDMEALMPVMPQEKQTFQMQNNLTALSSRLGINWKGSVDYKTLKWTC